MQHRRRLSADLHRAAHGIDELMAGALDLVEERDALEVREVLLRIALGERADAGELAAEVRADRRALLGRVVKRRLVRRRGVDTGAEKEDALLLADPIGDEIHDMAEIGPLPHSLYEPIPAAGRTG